MSFDDASTPVDLFIQIHH